MGAGPESLNLMQIQTASLVYWSHDTNEIQISPIIRELMSDVIIATHNAYQTCIGINNNDNRSLTNSCLIDKFK